MAVTASDVLIVSARRTLLLLALGRDSASALNFNLRENLPLVRQMFQLKPAYAFHEKFRSRKQRALRIEPQRARAVDWPM
jgi:hypothetical protein